ncbi:hypothetical protein LCGC14_0957870 [marine sediment metagenome]|uniref:Peptidase S9 prolyl oligopeptidase catalytic domain-containing protein n=1 Tax=marine sediment metagenome TaxID=412755 RepID=A0A0F9NJY9_9ZZZZ
MEVSMKNLSRQKKVTLFAFIVVAVCFLMNGTLLAQKTGSVFDVDDFLDIKIPSSIAWSPDGKHIAYQASGPKGSDIYLYSLEKGISKKLVSGIPYYDYLRASTEPEFRWTSDGKHIIYTTGQEYYTISLEGGEPQLLISGLLLGKMLRLSPDQKNVSFLRDGDIWVQSLAKGTPKRITQSQGFLTEDRQRFTRLYQGLQWSPDGSKIAYLSPTETSYKIGMVSIEGGETAWLITDEDIWSSITLAWSPDSQKIAVSRLSRDFTRKELEVYSISEDKVYTIWKDKDDKFVNYGNTPSFRVLWSPDSSRIAYLSNRDGWMHLYVANAEGKDARQLTKGDYDVFTYFWSVNQKEIFLISNKDRRHQRMIWSIPSNGGQMRQIIKREGICLARGCAIPSLSPDGKYLAYTFSGPNEPPGLWLSSISGKADSKNLYVSLPKKLRNKIETHMEPVSFKSSDGLVIPAVLLTAKNLSRKEKHPALVHMYGGWGQMALSGWGLGFKSIILNYLAQKGYVILFVDPRGSEGYGDDFVKAGYLEGGGKQVDDLAAGANYLKNLGYVEPEGIGIYGHSTGGFLTVQTMVQAPDVFAAGITQAGVYDWEIWKYSTYVYIRYGHPDKEPSLYRQRTPVYHVDKLKGALLVFKGTKDYNEPMSDTYKFVKALIKADKEFEFMVYPDEPHGLVKPETKRDFIKRAERFLDKYLRKKY